MRTINNYSLYQCLLDFGENKEMELEYKMSFGEKIIDCKLSSFLYKKQECCLAILKDTTVEKELEKEKAAQVFQKKILATITHELRTPLNGIIGMLELIYEGISETDKSSHGTEKLKEEDKNNLKKYTQVARNSSFLLLNLVNDILDFAQLESGSFKIVIGNFKLHKVVSECIDLISFQADKKNIKIQYTQNQGVPQIINSDKNRYRQIILNLLSNALKFTMAGKIRIQVFYNLDYNLLSTIVQDSGIGISSSDQGKLFKLFSKLDDFHNLNPQGRYNPIFFIF
jgi:signal transduction histidine kinase